MGTTSGPAAEAPVQARSSRAVQVREVAVAAAIARAIRAADEGGLRHWQEELRLLHRREARVVRPPSMPAPEPEPYPHHRRILRSGRLVLV